jgi:hypothetical protein
MTFKMSLLFEDGQETSTAEEGVCIKSLDTDPVHANAQYPFSPSPFPKIQPIISLQQHLPTVQYDQNVFEDFEVPELDFSSDWMDLFSDVQGIELENFPNTPSTTSIKEAFETPSSDLFSARSAISAGSDPSPTRADILVSF